MTLDEAKEYAKTMTYRDAISNLAQARSIPYRKATFIKIYELLDLIEPRAERIMTKKESEKYIKSKMCNDCSVHLGGGKCSDNCKVIEAIKTLDQEPVLDKIRERIELEKLGYPPSAGYYQAIMKVLQIIDKQRQESEE